MTTQLSNCARCAIKPTERACSQEDGKGPSFCPTLNCEDLAKAALEETQRPEILKFARNASIQEAEGYTDKELGWDRVRPAKPRITEIIEFAQRMAYKRLGLAFCAGLQKEAGVVEKLMSDQGFEVVSAMCKMSRTPKEEIDLADDQKIRIGEFEAMCHPIGQAFVLNDAKTEFNVLMGLCVGHDSLFFKYSEAPTTVFAVKDRLLGHNPLAAIYTIDTFYRSLKSTDS